MELISLVELVVGALTGLHGIGWLMRRRWKVGLASLAFSLLVNAVFFFLFVPSAGLAVIPQLSLQIGWSLFSARALNDELRRPTPTPPAPVPPYMQLPAPPHTQYQQPAPGATPQYQAPPARPSPPSGRRQPQSPYDASNAPTILH